MKESVIATSHHYYLTFLHAKQIKSVNDVLALLTDKFEREDITIHGRKYVHIQVQIEHRYGSENVLIGNRIEKKGRVYYFYDMYLGKTEVGNRSMFFIAYPYFRLRNYLDQLIQNAGIEPLYFKPIVKTAMEYMKKGLETSSIENGKRKLQSRIIRYTANIRGLHEDGSKVNIIGGDPLSSRAFNILNDDPELTVSTSSLKLQCTITENDGKETPERIELAFDKLGNYRFWIKRDGTNSTLGVIAHAFDLFKKIDAVKEDAYIGNQTLLEDE